MSAAVENDRVHAEKGSCTLTPCLAVSRSLPPSAAREHCAGTLDGTCHLQTGVPARRLLQ
eukprot:4624443-Pyramimonas_sp.AAC.1